MKTLEQAIEITKNSKTAILDNRTFSRMAEFLTAEQIEDFGFTFNSEENRNSHTPREFTEEAVLEILKSSVAFGFEKALDQRGISSELMYHVVNDFNNILENGVDVNERYAQYGLPLFKATALHYGWDNPIGDDTGSEDKYSSYY